MVKVKYLSWEETLKHYPVKAYYDVKKDCIYIPSKDDLFNAVFLHEYVHHLRRDKFTLKYVASIEYMLLVLSALAIAYFIAPFYRLIVLPFIYAILVSFIYCYFYEEVYIQKKLIKELRNHVEEIVNKETEKET